MDEIVNVPDDYVARNSLIYNYESLFLMGY